MSNKSQKVWFKWQNGNVQRVYVYKEFILNGEKCFRGKMGRVNFVLKEKDYGTVWSLNKEDLL